MKSAIRLRFAWLAFAAMVAAAMLYTLTPTNSVSAQQNKQKEQKPKEQQPPKKEAEGETLKIGTQLVNVLFSVQDLARAMLGKRNKELRLHGQRLVHMHPEERHETRIAAKKLRYAAEFFSGLYPAAKARAFNQSLAQLQDVLGVLNDIAVTENLIHRLIGQRPVRALDEAFHIFNGWNGCNAMHGLAHMEAAWNRFAGTAPFWRGE